MSYQLWLSNLGGKRTSGAPCIESCGDPSPVIYLTEPSCRREWNSAGSSLSVIPQVCYAALLYTHQKCSRTAIRSFCIIRGVLRLVDILQEVIS